jgi:hypothetical protein
MRWALSRIVRGLIIDRSALPLASFSVVVSWMYSRTSLFSRGMTITLPELALCIARRNADVREMGDGYHI